MLYSNTLCRFCTDPGQGLNSSRYYVFKNGVVRAKLAVPEIHVRPGKNICYISANSRAGHSDRPKSMKLDDAYVTYAAAMTANSAYQKPAVGMSPIDFYLNDNGEYEGSWHDGHGIASTCKATIGDKPVDMKKLDRYIAETYADEDDATVLKDGVQVETVSLEGFLKWLSDGD